MKHLKSKIYISFSILFILLLLISTFAFYQAFKTFQENKLLQSESEQITTTVWKLETMITKLHYLGQRHIYSKDEEETKYLQKLIISTYDELDLVIEEMMSQFHDEETKDTYEDLSEKWMLYLKYYKKAIELSRQNREKESQEWLLKANYEYEELSSIYLNELRSEGNRLVSILVEKQNLNLQRYFVLGIIILMLTILGFIMTIYYLGKVLKQSMHFEEKLEFLAYHDELTKLPNRRMFQKQVSKVINHSKNHFAVMFIDMDKLKTINDTFGHDIGDLVIKEFANRVSNCLRETDLFSRQGGDEFTVLLSEIGKEEVVDVARNIVQSFDQPLIVDGLSYFVSASIGIAFYPENGGDYIALLKNADDALYEAKKVRNAFVLSTSNG